MTSRPVHRAATGLVIGLLVAAFLLIPFSIMQSRGTLPRWPGLFSPAEDGSWLVVSIDRRPVPPGEYIFAIDDGEVVGGRDGCNSWSFGEERGPHGSRSVITTLAACPENATAWTYRALSYGDARIALRSDGTLRLRSGSHEAIARRCRWQQVRHVTPWSTSDTRECLPE